ncbi:MAG: nucleotidyltransferase family protein [Chloroflexus aggregans]|uniref:Nucleotidyltransferase family protein n=1 Tax=Chloroflexus aggregans TaxID=152260 RepID=A0A2J6XFD2_9CHLR|nr:MAG: nucleotidyltransferase family protein [Chloroflexus aggregans]
MKIVGLLLAAGQSSRMGQPKQLLLWKNRPLVAHIAHEALNSQLDGLTVVIGAAGEHVQAALRDLPVTIVSNPAYAAGISTSLAAGLRALPSDTTAAMILLVDQPLVTSRLINDLIAAYRATPTALALVPMYQGQRGNPVIVGAPLFAELQTLQGDTGARTVFQRYTDQIIWYQTNDPAIIIDADTPEAWQALHP